MSFTYPASRLMCRSSSLTQGHVRAASPANRGRKYILKHLMVTTGICDWPATTSFRVMRMNLRLCLPSLATRWSGMLEVAWGYCKSLFSKDRAEGWLDDLTSLLRAAG
eukprot:6458518-Amphidinium_carterae.2